MEKINNNKLLATNIAVVHLQYGFIKLNGTHFNINVHVHTSYISIHLYYYISAF